EDLHHEVGAGDAVDRAVVHLADNCDLAVGETLDDPELPQRPRPVERTARDVTRDLGDLLWTARHWTADAADVVVEVEVGVVDPRRVRDAERHGCEPTPELRHEMHPVGERLLDAVE